MSGDTTAIYVIVTVVVIGVSVVAMTWRSKPPQPGPEDRSPERSRTQGTT